MTPLLIYFIYLTRLHPASLSRTKSANQQDLYIATSSLFYLYSSQGLGSSCEVIIPSPNHTLRNKRQISRDVCSTQPQGFPFGQRPAHQPGMSLQVAAIERYGSGWLDNLPTSRLSWICADCSILDPRLDPAGSALQAAQEGVRTFISFPSLSLFPFY